MAAVLRVAAIEDVVRIGRAAEVFGARVRVQDAEPRRRLPAAREERDELLEHLHRDGVPRHALAVQAHLGRADRFLVAVLGE